MLFHTLIRAFDSHYNLATIPNVEIRGLSEDSRLTSAGDLFIARPGVKADGKRYIHNAVARGAAAVIADSLTPGLVIPQIIIPDPAAAISPLAETFYANPSQSVRVLAVTGTNGKTTTAFLVRHMLAQIGRACGVIGTVEIDDCKNRVEAEMTTPAPIEVSRLIRAMRDNGAAACAIEASSHALHQHRLDGLCFSAAAFTNLTGDHLDYHEKFEYYADAKARLFEMLPADAIACLNAGDPQSHRMIRDCRASVVWWGLGTRGDYRAEEIHTDPAGSHFQLITPRGRTQVDMGMIGNHNIANALTAAALVGERFPITPEQIAEALHTATGAPGRLQPIRMGQPFGVFVDYAHTDDGLLNVLTALRGLTPGRLRVVFGCGGDRDNTKRPRMAMTAEKLADVIYVTSDNPRTEDPGSIIKQILAGFGSGAAQRLIVEADRRKAIQLAISDARPGDVVLLAGKGHENYQIVGTEKHHFDDVEEARSALSAVVSQSAAA